jgi:anti-sigma B factor antagonist
VATSVPSVVLDMRGVEFMDSTGLRVLLRAQAESDLNGHTLTLRQPTPTVRRVMEITRTLERFTIEE